MASSMFQLAYGYTLRNDQDPYFLHAQEAVDHVIEAAMFSSKLGIYSHFVDGD